MKLPEDHQRLAALLSSLTASISTVQFSRGRWSTVQSTVRRLSDSLASLALSPSSSSSSPSPLLEELLSSLSQTLSLTLSLSHDSQSPSPKNGKLHTQSDIAAASAALDRAASDLRLLLLDPSGPNNNLVARLQIGPPSSRIAALDALAGQDDKTLISAVDPGAVSAIVRLLDSHETRDKAVAAIARVSAVDTCRTALMAESAGILNQLARVLESESGFSKENACVALKNLTLERDNAILVSSRGGILSLLEICRSGTPSAVAAAAGVLKNLAAVKELGEQFLEENAVGVLVRVLRSGTLMAQENSMGCLSNLAAGEEQNMKIAIFREGVLDCMVDYMEGGRNLQPAIGLLRNLVSLKYVAEIIQSSDLLGRVILGLDDSKPDTRIEAAMAIGEFNGKARKEIEDAVPRLVRMLEAKGSEEKSAAVKALALILKGSSGMRRAFQKGEKGIVNAVVLLDPFVKDVEKKYVVEILMLVSQSRKSRRQMVALGACGFLRRLEGMEVEGAKRLLACLEKGKFWGVFPRN